VTVRVQDTACLCCGQGALGGGLEDDSRNESEDLAGLGCLFETKNRQQKK